MTTKNLNQFLQLFFSTLALVLLFLPATAQRPSGSVGIGAQFGSPTGLSLKIYQPTGLSTDILAAWDLDDFFFLNVHGLIERHIDADQRFHYFVGPGVFAGIRDTGADDDLDNNSFAAGISGTAGLNFIIGRVEIFGQITPRLELIEETDGAIGGGGGIRVYFDR